jgi:hypothetical protein
LQTRKYLPFPHFNTILLNIIHSKKQICRIELIPSFWKVRNVNQVAYFWREKLTYFQFGLFQLPIILLSFPRTTFRPTIDCFRTRPLIRTLRQVRTLRLIRTVRQQSIPNQMSWTKSRTKTNLLSSNARNRNISVRKYGFKEENMHCFLLSSYVMICNCVNSAMF